MGCLGKEPVAGKGVYLGDSGMNKHRKIEG